MKVPISWLQEFIPVPTDGEAFAQFCDALTMAGLEVEENQCRIDLGEYHVRSRE